MEPITTKQCAACGKAVTVIKRCAGCAEGVDANGQLVPTFYCSKACQTVDWPNHKAKCKEVNVRKELYRAGSMLQGIFYAFREAAFDRDFAKVEQAEDKKIHVYEGSYEFEGGDRVLIPFPNHMKLADDVKKAVLTWNACDEFPAQLHYLAKKLLTSLCSYTKELRFCIKVHHHRMIPHDHLGRETSFGICYVHRTLAIGLPNGEQYIIDVAGAQYGQYRAVMPFQKYKDEYFHTEWPVYTSEFGAYVEERHREIEGGEPGLLATELAKAMAVVADELNDLLDNAEVTERVNLAQVLKAKEDEFVVTSETLFDFIKEGLTQFAEQVEQEAKERAVQNLQQERQSGVPSGGPNEARYDIGRDAAGKELLTGKLDHAQLGAALPAGSETVKKEPAADAKLDGVPDGMKDIVKGVLSRGGNVHFY